MDSKISKYRLPFSSAARELIAFRERSFSSPVQPWNSKRPHQVRFDRKNKNMRDSLLAWKLVQDGRKVVDGALLFYNPNLVRTPYWATVSQRVATIGSHHFYIPNSDEG